MRTFPLQLSFKDLPYHPPFGAEAACLTLPPEVVPPRNFGSYPFPSTFFMNERHFHDCVIKTSRAAKKTKKIIELILVVSPAFRFLISMLFIIFDRSFSSQSRREGPASGLHLLIRTAAVLSSLAHTRHTVSEIRRCMLLLDHLFTHKK